MNAITAQCARAGEVQPSHLLLHGDCQAMHRCLLHGSCLLALHVMHDGPVVGAHVTHGAHNGRVQGAAAARHHACHRCALLLHVRPCRCLRQQRIRGVVGCAIRTGNMADSSAWLDADLQGLRGVRLTRSRHETRLSMWKNPVSACWTKTAHTQLRNQQLLHCMEMRKGPVLLLSVCKPTERHLLRSSHLVGIGKLLLGVGLR